MTMVKFLEELQFLLSDLPEEEREEALDFYRGYFEDAGVENEVLVLEELGSPEKVAYTIRQGLKSDKEEGEFTEHGFHSFVDRQAPATRDTYRQEQTDEQAGYRYISVEEQYKERFGKGRRDSRKHRGQKTENAYSYGQSGASAEAQKESGRTRKQEQKFKRKVPAPLQVLGEIGMVILKILMVIATICVVGLLLIALVSLIAVVVISLGVTMGFLFVGIGILFTGGGLLGAALLGLASVSFAAFILLLLALVAFIKKGFAQGMRGITGAAGRVLHGRKKEV